jgi:hypothetical protein
MTIRNPGAKDRVRPLKIPHDAPLIRMQPEVAFAIELLALAAGAGLLSRAGEAGIYARPFIKAAGYFISIAAVALMLYTAYFEIQFACGDYRDSMLLQPSS